MQNRKTINNYLGNRGLSTLDDPQGLCAQLGYLVEDEAHFRQIINRCEPQYRRDMYESLRPHLHFEPRPLDVYVAELGMEAEIQQLPTLDEEGHFVPFRVQNIQLREDENLHGLVTDLVEEAVSQHHLAVTCRACTREQTFHAGTRVDAIWKSRQAGWTYGVDRSTEEARAYEICPTCSKAS